jgi:putative DNA primase/helicase
MFIEFKQGEKHASPTADQSEYHEPFKDCGYLLKNDEIVIDIDGLPKQTIEKLITTFDIKTQIVYTTRGCHLYYRLPKGHKNKSQFI